MGSPARLLSIEFQEPGDDFEVYRTTLFGDHSIALRTWIASFADLDEAQRCYPQAILSKLDKVKETKE